MWIQGSDIPRSPPFVNKIFGLRYDWADLGREAWGAALGPTCETQTRQSNPKTLTLDPKASEKQPTTHPTKRFRNPFPGRGLLSPPTPDKELGSRPRPRPQTPAQCPKTPKSHRSLSWKMLAPSDLQIRLSLLSALRFLWKHQKPGPRSFSPLRALSSPVILWFCMKSTCCSFLGTEAGNCRHPPQDGPPHHSSQNRRNPGRGRSSAAR